jgi:hypothetical protein
VGREGFRQWDSQEGGATAGAAGEIDAGEFLIQDLEAEPVCVDGQGRMGGCGKKVVVFGGQQEGAGLFPFGGGVAGSQEAEVADADEAVREDVQEKASEELLGVKTDNAVGTGLMVVSCTEGHNVAVSRDDTLVGDGGSMGVMAEVSEDMLGTEEGRLGVGVPLDSLEVPNEPFEGGAGLEMPGALGEGELCVLEGLHEAVEKLSP